MANKTLETPATGILSPLRLPFRHKGAKLIRVPEIIVSTGDMSTDAPGQTPSVCFKSSHACNPVGGQVARAFACADSGSTSHFLNLANGIEWLPQVPANPHYVRIQSTACEQKRWWFIVEDLDYTLLLRLAAGDRCIVYDGSARKEQSRAIYQGLEWIRFAVSRSWFGRDTDPVVRGHRCAAYFNDVWQDRTPRAERKLAYVAKFLSTDEIRLEGVSRRTRLDGQYGAFANMLALPLAPSGREAGR